MSAMKPRFKNPEPVGLEDPVGIEEAPRNCTAILTFQGLNARIVKNDNVEELEIEIPIREVDHKIVKAFTEAYGLTESQADEVVSHARTISLFNTLFAYKKY